MQALVHRPVLGVDRHDVPAPGRAPAPTTRPVPGDERLLVGQRQPRTAGRQRGQRQAQAGETPTTPLTQTSATVPSSARAAAPACTSVPGGTAASDLRNRRLVAGDLAGAAPRPGQPQGVDRRPGAERHHLEPVELGLHHLDGLGADRPSRPGDGDGR